ncbi:MAG: fused MFS/spermidine synthase [Alphaproteobacteria bacterium]
MVHAVLRSKALFIGLVYANALVLGAAVMGFEMLGSRYLDPAFGGTIFTWGALISTVLLSLMVGAYGGGHLADRYPSAALLAGLIAVAGLYFLGLYVFGGPMIDALAEAFDFSRWGLLAAALLLNFIPISLFGTFTPFAVRLMIQDTGASGRLVGRISAIHSMGSIIGTIGTTFFLVPLLGTGTMTLLFGIVVLVSALSLFLLEWIPAAHETVDDRHSAIAAAPARGPLPPVGAAGSLAGRQPERPRRP